MLKSIKQTISLFGILLSLGGFAYAAEAELVLWQVPEVKGKIPVFYQEASKSSKVVSLFKPKQILQVLTIQKDWAKVSLLDNAVNREVAWIPLEEVALRTKIGIILNPSPYYCQVVVHDATNARDFQVVRQMFESFEGQESRHSPIAKQAIQVFLEFEQSLFDQYKAMLKVMDRLSSAMSAGDHHQADTGGQNPQLTQPNVKKNKGAS